MKLLLLPPRNGPVTEPSGSRVNVTLNLVCCHQFLQYLCALGNILEGENKDVTQ